MADPSRHPTIKTVAEAAGVHFATVSRALRGQGRLPAATRERIRAAAETVGYVPHPALQALTERRVTGAVRRRPKIGVVFNRSPANGFENYLHYRGVLCGVRRRAAELGYECEALFVDNGAHTSRSLHRHLEREGIRGLVCAAFEPRRPTLELPWDDYCVVKFDSQEFLPAFTFISIDQVYYTRTAFRMMRALGYRRIGMAVGGDDAAVTDGRHTAALLLEQAAVAPDERVRPFFFTPNMGTDEAIRALRPWLARERVDAVICDWPQAQELVGPYLAPSGRPVACAAMCMDHRIPGAAGIVGDMQLIGMRAVELLAGLLQAGRRGIPGVATSTFVRGTWHHGATAPRCRAPGGR